MTKIIARDIWKQLSTTAKKSRRPAYVAVAFFGQGAARQLPLPEGSRLVVNAGERTVKGGVTCPAELKKLVNKGVRVYSIDNLHAKVFVLGNTAFIGSANVSQLSANGHIEAMVATTEPDAVEDARQFVRDLCLQELGPEELDRLQAMYRPPRIPGSGGRRKTQKHHTAKPALRRVLLAQLALGHPPEGSESTQEDGRRIARKHQKQPKLYVIDDFWNRGQCSYRRGDTVVQVVKEDDGRQMISPPGNVVHTRVWRRGTRKCTFVYVEVPQRKRIALDRLATRLGSGAKKRLRRGGQISRDFAKKLLAAWNK